MRRRWCSRTTTPASAPRATTCAAHIASIFENWPDLRFEGRSTYVGEDFVVQEWTAFATHPTGVPLSWEGVDIFPFRDGKILRKDVYSNASRRVPEQLAGA